MVDRKKVFCSIFNPLEKEITLEKLNEFINDFNILADGPKLPAPLHSDSKNVEFHHRKINLDLSSSGWQEKKYHVEDFGTLEEKGNLSIDDYFIFSSLEKSVKALKKGRDYKSFSKMQ